MDPNTQPKPVEEAAPEEAVETPVAEETAAPVEEVLVDILHFPSMEGAQNFLAEESPVVRKADVYLHVESEVHAPEGAESVE